MAIPSFKFNAEIGGFGDNLYLFWLAEGLKTQGIHPSFYAVRPSFRDLCRLFNQEISDSPANCWPRAGGLPFYHIEHNANFGRVPRLDLWAEKLPHATTPIRPKASIPPADLAWAHECRRVHTKDGKRGFVLLLPVSYYNTRNWTRAHWLDLAYRLEELSLSTACIVEPGQSSFATDNPGFPYSYWSLSTSQLAALMSVADLSICVSSGPSVLAGTLDAPCLVLSGPTTGCYDKMPSVRDLAVPSSKCGCVGCNFNGHLGFSNICDAGCRAMLSISVQDVIKEVLSMLPTFSGRAPQKESDIHPHVEGEKAFLFTAVDSQSTETEYLELLYSLVRCTKPVRVLETGAHKGRGTLTLAAACKANGLGEVHSLEQDENLCSEVNTKLASYALPGVCHPTTSIAWLNSCPDQYDFVFLDTALEMRHEELDLLCKYNLLSDGALVCIHDTSKARTTRDGSPDPRTTTHWEGLLDTMIKDIEHGSFERIHLPLSRGMTILRRTLKPSEE